MDSRRILLDQNPWWTGQPYQLAGGPHLLRPQQGAILAHLLRPEERRALVLLGPRQVGKTTLLRLTIASLLDDGYPPDRIFYADLQELAYRGFDLREVLDLMPPPRDASVPTVFCLDEIHYCRGWATTLKTLVDQHAGRFLLTGSASRELLQSMEESLPGRYDRFELWGFSLDEFRRLHRLRSGQDLPSREYLAAYLERGGYPEHIMQADLAQVRRRIREDVELRVIGQDLVARLGIRHETELGRFFITLVEHPGAFLNLKQAAEAAGVTPRSGGAWLNALIEASVLARLDPVAASGRQARRQRQAPKIYPTDPGLAAAYTITGDYGRRLEAAVFRHLREVARKLEATTPERVVLGYHDTAHGREVDFLLRVGERTLAVEVTVEVPVTPKKVQRFAGAIRDMQPRPTRAVLVCLEPAPHIERTAEGQQIEILPAEDFLLGCSDPQAVLPR